MTAENTLLCCECREEIDESRAFSFRGAFACEKCVRDYYRERPDEVELELAERRHQAIRMLKHRPRQLPKRPGRKKAVAVVTPEMEKLLLHCVECGAEIRVSAAFEFGGSVACEKCVRDYYRKRPSELEFELQLRKRNAVAWVKRNQKTLERKQCQQTM